MAWSNRLASKSPFLNRNLVKYLDRIEDVGRNIEQMIIDRMFGANGFNRSPFDRVVDGVKVALLTPNRFDRLAQQHVTTVITRPEIVRLPCQL
jgi:hypothetical protein